MSFDFIRRALAHAVIGTTASGITLGSSSKAKLRTTNTVNYLINGVPYSVTTGTLSEVAFTATTHDIIADANAAQERRYLLCVDSSGVGSIVAGKQSAAGAANWPLRPDNKAVLGGVILQIAAGSNDFDATTDELDEAHITDTYYGWIGAFLPALDGSDFGTISDK